ncbi:DEAD-box type RNA helicase, partial [Coemansia sp. RSA 1939]
NASGSISVGIPSLPELNRLLKRKRGGVGDGNPDLEFFQAGLLYFVENKAKCWWCNSDSCDAAMEMLHLFSIAESEHVIRYKTALAEQLTECEDCIVSYYASKAELRKLYAKQYKPNVIEPFFSGLGDWDAKRIVRNLANIETKTNASWTSVRIALIDALSDSANILFHSSVAAAVTKYALSSLRSGSTLDLGSRLLPGFMALCFSKDRIIRTWAWRSLKLATNRNMPASFAMVEIVFVGILNHLATNAKFRTICPVSSSGYGEHLGRISFSFSADEAWHGMRVALSRLDNDFKARLVDRFDKLSEFVCQSLMRIEGTEFIEALRVFGLVIGAAEKSSVWPQISRNVGCTPEDFVTRIMGCPSFRRRFEIAADDTSSKDQLDDTVIAARDRQLRPVLEWVTPFIESLRLPKDSVAIVAILKELLFKIRPDERVSQVNAAIATHTAMAIITHCLKLPTADRYMPDGKHLLGEFLLANYYVISDIAQGRDALSQSEMLISGAENLTELMLCEDLANMFKSFSEFSETAQRIQDNPDLFAEFDAKDREPIPILLHLPSVWECVLTDPQNTNVVRKSVYATSYILLFDPLPGSLLNYLPQQWRDVYKSFERKRATLASLLKNVLLLLATSLADVDPAARYEFEQEIMPSLLRLLVSPWTDIHPIVLQILRVTPLDLNENIAEGLQHSSKSANTALSTKRQGGLSDSERDLVCNGLFESHQYHFIRSLTDIVSDCRVLVSCNRPAYTCSSNIALYARSSISAVSDLSGSTVSETIVKLFFAFCSLLGSILKTNPDNEMQIRSRSAYMDSVLDVFNAVYDMLNSLEFAGFVRMVIKSAKLNEGEAMDALSMCVSQMMNYLESDDPLGVSGMIVRMFGLIANGLAATRGMSMLYLKETVDELIMGKTGRLTTEMRAMLRQITEKPVWEARSKTVSLAQPVQIIIDGEDVLSLMDSMDLSEILDDSLEMEIEDKDPIVLIDKPNSGYWAELSTSSHSPSTHASAESSKMAGQPRLTQFTSSDANYARQKKQMSMKDFYSKQAFGKDDSLTARLKQKSAVPPSTAPKTRKSNKSSGSLFDNVRNSYVSMRQDARSGGAGAQKLPPIPKQTVKAPRSMAIPGYPVSTQKSEMRYGPYAPSAGEGNMYIRDVSEAALRELEDEKNAKMEQSRSRNAGKGYPVSTKPEDSDSSSSDEGGGAGKRRSGLAELCKIPKHVDSRHQPRLTMKMMSPVGRNIGFGSRFGATGGQFYDQESRDRAHAEHITKMRLTPNVKHLYKRLLGWRYEDSGEFPPDIKQSDLQKVPDTFVDCSQYHRIFEPVLLLESWAQFQRAKEESENNDTGEATLESRTGLDDFQEIAFRMTPADAEMISEYDMLVFAESTSHEKRLASSGTHGVQLENNVPLSKRLTDRLTFLAMVKTRIFGRKGAEVVVRVYFGGSRNASMLSKLLLNSCWEFFKLYSIIPVQREYAGLLSLEHLDECLVREILSPKESLRRQNLSHSEIQQMMNAHALNQPQAESVASAIKLERGFTLIQGPPGTGKTKTILGLAGALVSASRRNADSNSNERNNSAEPGPFATNKLLICAPSNAAVDEIVKRLKSGIRDNAGETFYPRVVRIGQSENISSTVRDTTLDFLMDKALNSFDSKLNSKSADVTKGMSDQQSGLLLDIAGQSRREDGKAVAAAAGAKEMHRTAQLSIKSLRAQLDEANDEIRELDAQRAKLDTSDTAAMRDMQDKYQKSGLKKKMITQKLVLERERVRGAGKAIDETKAKVRMQILQKTDILCCTLSGSGHDMLTSLNCTFETVIIDEAAQSIELSCLIPLKYGCKRCILVGDPNQLPPTVFSLPATQHLYNQSLFVRIQKSAPRVVNLLSIQYRMHPEISAFPSRLFYEARLRDGPEMAVKQRAPWHNSPNYPPFMFFNIFSGKERSGASHSVFNMEEVMAAVQLVYNLCMDYPNLPWKQRIGVITPYKQQLRKLVESFMAYFGDMAKEAIEFNTVDGFQGQEKDIIIFSCVRAGEGGVGFLSDRRRMNVGLTRARKSLFVLGNAAQLNVSPLWKQLIDDSRGRGLLRESTLPLFGKYVQRGVRLEGLLRDVSPGDSGLVADGEGDRSEFILEEIDDSQLNRPCPDSLDAKQVSAQPSQSDVPINADDDNLGDKRKHQLAVYDKCKASNQKPSDVQKRARLSEEPSTINIKP